MAAGARSQYDLFARMVGDQQHDAKSLFPAVYTSVFVVRCGGLSKGAIEHAVRKFTNGKARVHPIRNPMHRELRV